MHAHAHACFSPIIAIKMFLAIPCVVSAGVGAVVAWSRNLCLCTVE